MTPAAGLDRAPPSRQGLTRAAVWTTLALLSTGMVINYVDRGTLSVAAVPLMGQFHITPAAMGTLLSAYLWSYSLMQLPAGYLVDRFGLKWLYGGAFLLWCVAGAATGLAGSFVQILALRLLLGFAESPAHPATLAFIQRNYQNAERGLPTAVYLVSMQVGPALGALLGGYLMQRVGWREMFLLTGVGGSLWLIPWFLFARGESAGAAAVVTPAPPPRRIWPVLFSTPVLPGMLVGCFFYAYYWYFFLTWIPSYLVMERGFSFLQMGAFTSLPLAGMSVAVVVSCRVADRLIARHGRPLMIRRAFMCTGFVLGSCVAALPLAGSKVAVTGILLASLIGVGLGGGNLWALSQTVSPRAVVGRMISCINMVANFGGLCAPLLTGLLVQRTKHFGLSILVASGTLLVASACFAAFVREKDVRILLGRFGESDL
jgi:MFS family permease